MLPKVGKALIAGQWGVYKTFAAIDLAGSVMTLTPFAGRAVKRQGGVLFIAAEGQDEVRVRLEGIAREKVAVLQPRKDVVAVDSARMPFVWMEACPRLTSDTASRELREIAEVVQREMVARFSLPLALIIIDTLMPAAGFKDANDASEAQRVMTVLTDIAQAIGVLVVAVDHFGKSVETGTRNSSVKEDAVDAVLALLAERDLAGAVSKPRLAVRKVRGAPTGAQIPFATRSVVVACDNAGFDATTTLVLEWQTDEPVSGKTKPAEKTKCWPKSLIIFKQALENTIANVGQRIRPFPDGPEILAAGRDSVRDEFMKTYPADNRKAKGEAFRRSERDALSAGLMARDIWPPESAATFFWLVVAES
jgi:hypothetical protein